MYLPKFKYQGGLFTIGGEFAVKATGENYKGFYFRTYKGELYTGAEPSLKGNNSELIPLEKEEQETGTLETLDVTVYDDILNNPHEFKLKTTEQVPQHVPVVTVGDTVNGFIIRYFTQNKLTKQIIEINKQVYNELESRSVRYFYKNYSVVRINWFLSGELEDTQNRPYRIPGVRTKNLESIKSGEKAIPGLTQYLRDPLQFVV
jgi:hypothetical protein